VQDRLQAARGKLRDYLDDAAQTIERLLEHRGLHLEQSRTLLTVLSPQAALKRGYAVVRNDLGGVVRSAKDAPVGAIVHISVDSDEITAQVKATRKLNRKI
jgi:exonuclease VII large subunit